MSINTNLQPVRVRLKYPALHLSHFSPSTPSLHTHWPEASHWLSVAPKGSHPHSWHSSPLSSPKKPGRQESHLSPLTPRLQLHWPLLSQSAPRDPTGSQSQAVCRGGKMKWNGEGYGNIHLRHRVLEQIIRWKEIRSYM